VKILNMKKYLVLFFTISTLAFSGCIKDQGDPFEELKIQLAKDEEIIKAFIETNNIDAVRHETGLYYQIITPGSGSFVYSSNTTVGVTYRGKLLDGTVFDESTTKVNFTLGNLILGWQIGIPLIQRGGKIRLLVPSGYAYGTTGSSRIPANAILDFEIDLIDVQ
jgi:FKBP-type peptidyl-prolyl cis-trans isomerase FkpA